MKRPNSADEESSFVAVILPTANSLQCSNKCGSGESWESESRSEATKAGIEWIFRQSTLRPDEGRHESSLLHGGDGDVVHTANTGGVLSKHPTRDGDAASNIPQPISTHRQASEHLEILRLLDRQSLEERECFYSCPDFEQHIGEMKRLFERLFRLESVKRIFELEAGSFGFSAPEERFREASADERHVRVKPASNLEFNPSLIKPAE